MKKENEEGEEENQKRGERDRRDDATRGRIRYFVLMKPIRRIDVFTYSYITNALTRSIYFHWPDDE